MVMILIVSVTGAPVSGLKRLFRHPAARSQPPLCPARARERDSPRLPSLMC